MNYIMTIGYAANHEPLVPLELFINTEMRAGNAADVAVSDAAVAASLALQFGCPVRMLRDAMKHNTDGTPTGVIGRALDLILEANR